VVSLLRCMVGPGLSRVPRLCPSSVATARSATRSARARQPVTWSPRPARWPQAMASQSVPVVGQGAGRLHRHPGRAPPGLRPLRQRRPGGIATGPAVSRRRPREDQRDAVGGKA